MFHPSVNTRFDNETEEDARKIKLKKYCEWTTTIIILCIFIAVIAVILPLSLHLSHSQHSKLNEEKQCASLCSYKIAESIPTNITLPRVLPQDRAISTFQAWEQIIKGAQDTLDIAAFYIALKNNYTAHDHIYDGYMGNTIFEEIVKAHKRGVRVRIVVNNPKESPVQTTPDAEELKEHGVDVQYISFGKLFGGILHSKFMVADGHMFYSGSANMAWKSLAQVKELGIFVQGCKCLAHDLSKIFDVYYYLATHNSKLPDQGFPQKLNTQANRNHPFNVKWDKNESQVYISSSPKPINPPQREDDIKAILHIINSAEEYIEIEVMDYYAARIFDVPHSYWGQIDDALRNAVLRNVNVRFMFGRWKYTTPEMLVFMNDLVSFSNLCDSSEQQPWCNGTLTVKQFEVPDLQGHPTLPFTRVNHAKFMVTEKIAYIGTSNWSKDYFYNTAGVGFVSNDEKLQQYLHETHERDWNSDYASVYHYNSS
eukprot:gb/GECH01004374.1/.p1 GENE.gb/GECH01004374.1/~~gb/GECH01004374.1/.p1  ORF type:complete len:482 (+),score=102.91 gb/GECH01004374.1/:1-1446(+)